MQRMWKVSIIFLFITILLVGCAQKQAGSPLEKGLKKCNELNGFTCKSNEECKATLLTTSDSDKCCSTKCEAKPTTDNVEIPKFDFGKADDSLGSLQQ